MINYDRHFLEVRCVVDDLLIELSSDSNAESSCLKIKITCANHKKTSNQGQIKCAVVQVHLRVFHIFSYCTILSSDFKVPGHKKQCLRTVNKDFSIKTKQLLKVTFSRNIFALQHSARENKQTTKYRNIILCVAWKSRCFGQNTRIFCT